MSEELKNKFKNGMTPDEVAFGELIDEATKELDLSEYAKTEEIPSVEEYLSKVEAEELFNLDSVNESIGVIESRQRIAYPNKLKSGNISVFGNPDFDFIFSEVKRLNLNTVTYPILVQAQNTSDSEPKIDEANFSKGKEIIRKLGEIGVNVILEPFPYIDNGSEVETNWNPSNKETWFEHWGIALKTLADFAEEEELYGIYLASNLVHMDKETDEWSSLINSIRNHFKGQLIYRINYWRNATWAPELNEQYTNIIKNPILKMVDIVAIAAYFELTDQENPSIEDLKNAIHSVPYNGRNQNIYEEIKELANETKKPIFFGELGIAPYESAMHKPWQYEFNNEEMRPDVQGKWFKAWSEAFENEEWFLGFSIFAIADIYSVYEIHEDNNKTMKELMSKIVDNNFLYNEIQKMESKFPNINKELSVLNKRTKGIYSNKNTNSYLVVQDDDISIRLYTEIYPWAKQKGIPIVAALVTNFIDTDGYISYEQFVEMKESGVVEFVNHTQNHLRLADLTPEEIHYEIGECEKFLMNEGIHTKHLVYPYGSINDTVKEISSHYVNSATKSNQRIIDNSKSLLDRFQINRIVLEHGVNNFNNRITEAINRNGSIIINVHAHYESFDISDLDTIVTNAENAGMKVVNYTTLFEKIENPIDIKRNNSTVLGVSSEGYIEGIGETITRLDQVNFSLTPESHLDEYPIGSLVVEITTAKSRELGWQMPEEQPAAVLETYNNHYDYAYQILHPIRSTGVYKRSWISTGSGRWGSWYKISGTVVETIPATPTTP